MKDMGEWFFIWLGLGVGQEVILFLPVYNFNHNHLISLKKMMKPGFGCVNRGFD